MRNTYIDNIQLETAKDKYLEALKLVPKFEKVSIYNALGRVTKKAVYAKYSSPFYNAAAMDGIAVISNKTNGATEVNPLILLEGKDFEYINTGNAIKEPFDAVIMIEDVTEISKGKVKIIKAAHPWQHIRPIGEDIVASEMILPSNHQIRAIDLGALLSGGITEVEVYSKINVGILPTGNEIINGNEEIKVGKIIDSNSAMFEGLVKEYGGQAKRYLPVEDNYEELKKAILKGVEENDLLIINAGSSAGTKDFTVHLIRELGEVIVHGIAIKPGKPTILGIIKGKPVIGIPGYPVSAYISFENFVRPLILKQNGLSDKKRNSIEVVIGRRIVSSLKHQEKVRVTIGYINGRYIAVPLNRGAGTTMSLVRADGIITIPQNVEGFETGEVTKALLLKPIETIEKTIVSVGSHDIVMDLISNKIPLSSSHVGSMGGIMALKKGECHIAPIHLLDENDGSYNINFVKKYFDSSKVVLIKGVKRSQGFLVAKGNPKKIKGFEDLIREDVHYVNRQRGAGTRILLDYYLKEKNIDSSKITGYERMVPTHMAVAIAVSSNTADVGLGIQSAAKALNLDFIEVAYEEYDFLTYKENLNKPEIVDFINLLKSEGLRLEIDKLGGYDCSGAGEIVYCQED